MSSLNIRSADKCFFDIVSLGEVMLRLDPGEGRIKNTRKFHVWEGGGEYNVARGLKRCFGKRSAIVTAIADNEVGLLLEDLILQGGVDTSLIHWIPYDGIGLSARNGLNFTERGFGVRRPLGCSDRGNTAASKMMPGDINWNHLFGKQGVRWLHTGGIFAALSENTAQLVIEAANAAKKNKTIVSYDLNFRPSLWKAQGGIDKCRKVNQEIVNYVDVLIGNVGQLITCLGLQSSCEINTTANIDDKDAKNTILQVLKRYPNIKSIALTLRAETLANINDWSAICWMNGEFYNARYHSQLEIFDRVGGGDSFAAGFIYGLIEYNDPAKAVEYGAAHGALTMTTPGDQSMASLNEVQMLVNNTNNTFER